MKTKYILAEFVLVFLFLAVPPLLVSDGNPAALSGSFSPVVAVQAAIALALDIQERICNATGTAHRQNIHSINNRFAAMVTVLKWLPLTFGLLLVTYAAMQTLALLCRTQAAPLPALPATPGGVAMLVLSLAVGAYYEEVLYRQYMPQTLLGLLESRPRLSALCECIPIFVFALSHRYLGSLSVANALCCGAVLRVCKKKTGSVYTGTAAHAAYNTFTVLALYLSGR